VLGGLLEALLIAVAAEAGALRSCERSSLRKDDTHMNEKDPIFFFFFL